MSAVDEDVADEGEEGEVVPRILALDEWVKEEVFTALPLMASIEIIVCLDWPFRLNVRKYVLSARVISDSG